jgi:hypothetical protein
MIASALAFRGKAMSQQSQPTITPTGQRMGCLWQNRLFANLLATRNLNARSRAEMQTTNLHSVHTSQPEAIPGDWESVQL